MDNGHEGKLAAKMSGLALNDSASSSSNFNFNTNHSAISDASSGANTSSNSDSLFQVIKAVEAAEVTIRQQVEENTRLRNELQRKVKELEKYKIDDSVAKRSHHVNQWNEQSQGPYEFHPSDPSVAGIEGRIRSMGAVHTAGPLGTLVLHQDMKHNDEDSSVKRGAESELDSSKINGSTRAVPGGKAPTEQTGLSQLSSPSSQSISPGRYQMEGEYTLQVSSAGHGLLQTAEANSSSALWKQDFSLKIRDHEEEISLLKRHLSDYSLKEAQIRNEKYVLEKRIAYMRLAFDQQQQDLVDAASKALSYRQDIIEENIRLTYELQTAQQERTTFVSSLLPLLAEYSLQPPVADAQSIVGNVRVLFRHLQEKLIQTESKLMESQYQLAPWHSDMNYSNVASQSPSTQTGVALNKNRLELVPQPPYNGNIPMASPNAQMAEWDVMSHHQRGFGGGVASNMEADDRGRYSPLASRNSATNDMPAQFGVIAADSRIAHHGEEITNRQVTFRELVSKNEMDESEAEGHQNEGKSSSNWETTTPDDPSTSYSPYLTPVLEEPSSSFSEAADDDPLPAIEGLQISGEAFPGRELQASGYSINGTTSCNFEWVRHLEDGSVDYIDGAKQPNYLVTADDVNTYLAIEVQPLDDRKRKKCLSEDNENGLRMITEISLSLARRYGSPKPLTGCFLAVSVVKGELVKVFANEQRKIVCDPEMQNHIERTLYNGHASYRISISTAYIGIWEPATLAIKREGYSIKLSGSSSVVVNEKFSPNTTVAIPYGQPTEFFITSSGDVQHVLRADDPMDSSSARDTIVLTLRLFILRAGEKKKGKKKSLFHKLAA